MARIDAFLKLGMQQGCSDVHLAVGVPPMLRMNGDLMPIKFRDVRAEYIEPAFRTARFELTMALEESADGVTDVIDYDIDLFVALMSRDGGVN